MSDKSILVYVFFQEYDFCWVVCRYMRYIH